jgi:hypothetical protein
MLAKRACRLGSHLQRSGVQALQAWAATLPDDQWRTAAACITSRRQSAVRSDRLVYHEFLLVSPLTMMCPMWHRHWQRHHQQPQLPDMIGREHSGFLRYLQFNASQWSGFNIALDLGTIAHCKLVHLIISTVTHSPSILFSLCLLTGFILPPNFN